MAGIAGILSALWRAVRRDLRSYHSLTANNFFLFALLVSYQQVEIALFFALVMFLLLLFPLAADPLAKIPLERLESWPISDRGRILLRIASMALSPAAWITIALVAATARPRVGAGFLLLALAIHSLTVFTRRLAARAPQVSLSHWVPPLPGRWGGLVRKDLRQMLAVLDTYIALVVSLCGLVFRFSGRATDPEVFPMLSMIVVLSLSTYAQCLFGLDIESGTTRYRLLPLRGWIILLAKGFAFLAVALILVLPLDPASGVAAAIAALAVGHHASVYTLIPQQRWRFTGGALFPHGFFQAIAIFGAGLGVHRQGVIWLAGAAVLYAGSLWFYGRAWDRQSVE